jgi:protein gp37
VPDNVWLGVSVEDRKYGLPRIDQLRKIESPIRFLSVEPLLEDLDRIDLAGIHWVIVGGESGPKARPMKSEWVESHKSSVKNAGSHSSSSNGADGVRTERNVPRKITGEFSLVKLGIKCLLRSEI